MLLGDLFDGGKQGTVILRRCGVTGLRSCCDISRSARTAILHLATYAHEAPELQGEELPGCLCLSHTGQERWCQQCSSAPQSTVIAVQTKSVCHGYRWLFAEPRQDIGRGVGPAREGLCVGQEIPVQEALSPGWMHLDACTSVVIGVYVKGGVLGLGPDWGVLQAWTYSTLDPAADLLYGATSWHGIHSGKCNRVPTDPGVLLDQVGFWRI
jgi:hypothetical protein